MKPKEIKKDNSFLYIVATLGFVLLGIILSSVINKTTSNDIRTKASETSNINATAVISSINSEHHTILVNNLVFTSSPNKNLGSWTVTPPASFNFSSIIVGNTVNVVIDPLEFDILNHTFTAKKIQKK